ncbi:MAG: hypothetical protein AUG55_02655 [Candidatus Rokubacteria bacterium 13_1_20CM_4_70_13]|nr:MAG: hypothetical protein AUG55_02655 [Candidatus Rokubacteria bacterium 13_1_20CM_4_70_13]
MRGVPFGVAVVAVGLYLVGLGAAPFIDPPEGLHAEVTRQMAALGDWITPRVDGVRYFDTPPLLYWLTSGSFAVAGTTPAAARLWPALAAVGVAAVTARLGVMLGGPRVGLLAGLMVATNLGVFLCGRIVEPDLVFVLWLTLAWAGFAIAYRGRGRRGLVLFYAALGLAAITKDIVGALAPLVVVAMFFWLTGERPLTPWVPWWSVLLLAAIALPWYVLVEARNRGFLWYTLVDDHVLRFARQRVFPDEDVPLGSSAFLLVTLLAFLPWALALPWALLRAFRRPWEDAPSRLWLLFALWAVVVVGFFTASPFKLPHHGLPAFPAVALIVARVWDETIDAAPGSARPRLAARRVAPSPGAGRRHLRDRDRRDGGRAVAAGRGARRRRGARHDDRVPAHRGRGRDDPVRPGALGAAVGSDAGAAPATGRRRAARGRHRAQRVGAPRASGPGRHRERAPVQPGVRRHVPRGARGFLGRAAAAGGVVRAEAAVPPLGRGPGALGRAHPGAGERPPHRADGWAMALLESCRSGYLRPMMVR